MIEKGPCKPWSEGTSWFQYNISIPKIKMRAPHQPSTDQPLFILQEAVAFIGELHATGRRQSAAGRSEAPNDVTKASVPARRSQERVPMWMHMPSARGALEHCAVCGFYDSRSQALLHPGLKARARIRVFFQKWLDCIRL